MKITQIKDCDLVWQDFFDYCVRSKPYSFCSLKSPKLRNIKIKSTFAELCDCQIYSLTGSEGPIAYYFISVEEINIHLHFAFAMSSKAGFSSKKFGLGAYELFDSLQKKYNKNYTRGEIARIHNVEPFKKWIEIFQKRVIFLEDKEKTLVWCKRNRMSVIFKVVGTNKTTEYLMGKKSEMGFVRKGPRTIVRELFFDNKKYLFDEKSVDFLVDRVLIHGFLSDDKENVGKIALEFQPHK